VLRTTAERLGAWNRLSEKWVAETPGKGARPESTGPVGVLFKCDEKFLVWKDLK
jgi:hypothetical protein